MKESDSYIAFKSRTQEIFDFAVLVTSSVPTFKYNLNLLSSGEIKRIPEPDFFQPSVIYEITSSTLSDLKLNGLNEEKLRKLKALIDKPLNHREYKENIVAQIGKEDYKKYRHIIKRQSSGYVENLRDCTKDYQKKLASYLYFSLFSYFEAFIGDLINEVINNFDNLDIEKYLSEAASKDYQKEIKVLDTIHDSRKVDRYKKYSQELLAKGYKEPRFLIFSSMLNMLKSSNQDLKANNIPNFLKRLFFFELSEKDNEIYHSLRDNRNSLGHGDTSFIPTLKNVIEANKFFKRVSRDIDNHVTRNFIDFNNFHSEK